LVVYLNCLKESFKKTYGEKWKKLGYVELIDNTQFINPDELTPGGAARSEEGLTACIAGKFEPGCVVWTREFRKFTTDYWATVDADFEILKPDFIVDAFDKLENNAKLAVLSSDCNGTRPHFDFYSGETKIIMRRYETWFCIYKKETQKCKTSHFYYEETVKYGLKLSFDDGAKFQWDLRDQFGYEMAAVDSTYKRQFLHYIAFSKNDSLDTPFKIALYRRIKIIARRGLMGSGALPDRIIRKTFEIIWEILYGKLNRERRTYTFHSRLDD
jgi:hypothetical protein